MEQNQDKIDLCALSANVNAIPLLKRNKDKLHGYHLSFNKNYSLLFEENLDIDWDEDNVSVDNFKLKTDWSNISVDNFNKKDWSILSRNINAIPILEKSLDKIDWCNLSGNKNAIHILEKNQDKINWYRFQYNENIFVNYK